VWAYGALVNQALEVIERFARRGVAVALVDARFAKPLDEELLASHLNGFRAVITLEEHQRAGGFGSAVLELASRLPNVRAQLKVVAIGDRYVEHMTTREEQLAESGIDADALERAVRNALAPIHVA
jgi:1-deoxy-D-xylulose-5-phosphate synthase